MTLPSTVDTAIVGAGQCGLAMSWFLRQAGREHVVLDRRPSLGGGWQDRWDAFQLVTPNWTASLPGAPYAGDDPDGFMTRDQIAALVAGYAATIDAPVELATGVTRLAAADCGGFRLETSRGEVLATRVIAATGGYHVPRIPAVGDRLPARLTQLHSHAYRSPASLPPGAVLVVGSGQSGVQIAEELAEAGRTVFLSVGGAGRLPRRYRGRDIFAWLAAIGRGGRDVGIELPTVGRLPDPALRLAGVPHLSGHHGGHETNLRRLAADGMRLVGRIERADGERLDLAPDLAANLARADRFFGDRMGPLIDTFIERAGIDAPPDDRVPFEYEPPEPRELDLDRTGISTVVWATGYDVDYSWIDLPIFDAQGYPRHRRGVSEIPGLAFIGMPWQHTMASATLAATMLDAPFLAGHLDPAPSTAIG